MYCFKRCLAFILVALSVPAFASELPHSVQQMFKQAGVPQSAISIYVSEVGAKKPIVSVNADVAMNPASVMKLVTTYAGLEILGPAFSWQTILYANGKISDGVLHGDLIIKGFGDPKLNLENFWLLTHRLRKTGLKVIAGNLVLDQTHYDVPNDDPGGFDGERYRTYNIIPEALLVNYRASMIVLMPQHEGNSVRAVVDPIPDSVTLRNNLKLTKGPCVNWRNAIRVDINSPSHERKKFLVELNGSYSVQCGKKYYMLGLHDSATYTRDLFKRLWMQQGGLLHGDVVTGEVPEGLSPLKVYQSPPLSDIIRGVNKFSNNIAARQLYLTLGAVDQHKEIKFPATLDNAKLALKRWLEAKDLNFPELVIENGSGLSRIERISANHLGALLNEAFQSPVMPEFISSLPIAGTDGTLKERFTDTPVSGLAHMKTGALNDVRAIAGYMLDKSGRRMIVVIFINHNKAAQSSDAMDALLHWVHDL